MSALSMADRRNLEKFLGMGSGYVLNFSDRTFGEFVSEAVDIDIHNEKYTAEGTSKAKKLRTFWTVEPDYTVGKLLLALIDYGAPPTHGRDNDEPTLFEKGGQIAARFPPGGPSLDPL